MAVCVSNIHNADWPLSRPLVGPLPNLFKVTFERAHRQTHGEQWLRQRVDAFDTAAKHKRKQILEEFLEYVSKAALPVWRISFRNRLTFFSYG